MFKVKTSLKNYKIKRDMSFGYSAAGAFSADIESIRIARELLERTRDSVDILDNMYLQVTRKDSIAGYNQVVKVFSFEGSVDDLGEDDEFSESELTIFELYSSGFKYNIFRYARFLGDDKIHNITELENNNVYYVVDDWGRLIKMNLMSRVF